MAPKAGYLEASCKHGRELVDSGVVFAGDVPETLLSELHPSVVGVGKGREREKFIS